MKALVYHAPGQTASEDHAKPELIDPTDAIIRITKTTICGTDLPAPRPSVPHNRRYDRETLIVSRERLAARQCWRAPAAAILLVLGACPAAAWEPVPLPAAVKAKLPAGYVARVASCSRTLDPPQPICIVVAARPDEGGQTGSAVQKAPARPLLVYRLADGGATLIDRNDRIVLRRDEGGQCDPIEDAGRIAIKGRYFTLESGVACGQHWTDFTTFRFDPSRRAFVWQNRIFESASLNSDTGPDAEAMVSDGRKVTRADPRHPVRLSAYRPR